MITCIVTSYYEMIKTKSDNALNKVFHEDRLETIEQEDGLTLLFIKHAKKMDVWQAALNLAVESISIGYGFGDKKEEAKKEALDRFKLVTGLKAH